MIQIRKKSLFETDHVKSSEEFESAEINLAIIQTD